MTWGDLNDKMMMNVTGDIVEQELFRNNETDKIHRCHELYEQETQRLEQLYSVEGFCEVFFDTLSCWPPTAPNTTAVISCFKELGGLRYNDSFNATKSCLSTGNWSNSNYSSCELIKHESHTSAVAISTIYLFGYSISLLALCIAIGIFIYFKDLRCLRNTIHTNLMFSYICVYSMWILTFILEINFESKAVCMILVILLNYFYLATFFWMFVEGLYLYILVVETLTRENFKIKIYLMVGWGVPVGIVVIWSMVKVLLPRENTSILWDNDTVAMEDSSALDRHCPYMQHDAYDYIHQCPIILVLGLNLFFLFAIMYVLITKLKSANTLETQQYRKMAKALFVLIPLLGGTYIITLVEPSADPSFREGYEYLRAVLLSTQGLMVALFYCFLNSEVHNNLKHHWDTWLTRRSISHSRFRSGRCSKDWSPRSRTESIRDTEYTTVPAEDVYNNPPSPTNSDTATTCFDAKDIAVMLQKPANGLRNGDVCK